SVALRPPRSAVDFITMSIRQRPPEGSDNGVPHVPSRVKSPACAPEMDTCATSSVTSPVFVMKTGCTGLAKFRATELKSTADRLTLMTGPADAPEMAPTPSSTRRTKKRVDCLNRKKTELKGVSPMAADDRSSLVSSMDTAPASRGSPVGSIWDSSPRTMAATIECQRVLDLAEIAT
ncbi:MAG: hypothetical protein ABI624_09665, partial [Casimicrobiaceae bacterium]